MVYPDRLSTDDIPSSSLRARTQLYLAQEQSLNWKGTFEDYYEIVRKDPNVARLSHQRVYDMMMAPGVEADDERTKYKFFEDEIFGLEDTLKQVVDYFSSGAKRLEVRKRILLFMGPVGGGKSTIVSLLKKGMEKYSKSEEGAVYAPVDCPMHEEPLHLIPEDMRAEARHELGVHIEGDLCPHCRYKLDEEYGGDFLEFPIKRITFSEKKRVGIGTFTPSDPKSQDITELTGSINLATIGKYGVESDPRAYRFDGELNIANRGVMEFVEMLKCDEKFLYGLLILTQEQSIKTGRFAMIYADEVILSHTNEAEYSSFSANKKTEALQDRIITVRVPYNLRVTEEIRIYEKLLGESNITGVHIAPETLRVISTFGVLSRLEPSQKAGMSLMKKLRLYDGQDVDGFTQADVKEIRDEMPKEGMDGISPRFLINRLSNAIIQDGIECVNPIDALRSLKEGIEQNPGMAKEKKDALLLLISEARKDYDGKAMREVQKAFIQSFEGAAQTVFTNYLDNVDAFCFNKKLKDPITGDTVAPDEKLMRAIEEQITISEGAKKAFREQILMSRGSAANRGEVFTYSSHDQLREAIEKKLFADLKDMVKITTSTKTPDADQLKRINEVVDRLCTKEHGYCIHCASGLLNYVGTLLNR